MKKEVSQLTICSVYHSDMTRRMLEMNVEFIRRMNPKVSWVHLAVNNSPGQAIRASSPHVREIPGAAIPDTAPPLGFVGYHEGAGLNAAIPYMKTRFALFLDQDFFIVRPNWIKDVLSHMDEHGVAIFAAPYHPKYWVKFRYAPGAYCILADRERIGDEFAKWDFKPQYTAEHLARGNASRERKIAWRTKRRSRPSWLRQFVESIKKRRYIGQSRDVSYDLHRRYSGDPAVNMECFAPTVVLDDFLRHYRVDPRWHPLLYRLERLVPERWSFVPKRPGYFTFSRFKDFGRFDVLGAGMEEYFWQDAPFAFHLRGFKERHMREKGLSFNPEESISVIRAATESFAAASGLPRS